MPAAVVCVCTYRCCSEGQFIFANGAVCAIKARAAHVAPTPRRVLAMARLPLHIAGLRQILLCLKKAAVRDDTRNGPRAIGNMQACRTAALREIIEIPIHPSKGIEVIRCIRAEVPRIIGCGNLDKSVEAIVILTRRSDWFGGARRASRDGLRSWTRCYATASLVRCDLLLDPRLGHSSRPLRGWAALGPHSAWSPSSGRKGCRRAPTATGFQHKTRTRRGSSNLWT